MIWPYFVVVWMIIFIGLDFGFQKVSKKYHSEATYLCFVVFCFLPRFSYVVLSRFFDLDKIMRNEIELTVEYIVVSLFYFMFYQRRSIGLPATLVYSGIVFHEMVNSLSDNVLHKYVIYGLFFTMSDYMACLVESLSVKHAQFFLTSSRMAAWATLLFVILSDIWSERVCWEHYALLFATPFCFPIDSNVTKNHLTYGTFAFLLGGHDYSQSNIKRVTFGSFELPLNDQIEDEELTWCDAIQSPDVLIDNEQNDAVFFELN